MQCADLRVWPAWLVFSLSGFLIGLAIVWPALWWLVFFGVGLFFWAIMRAESWYAAGWGGWVAGTIKTGWALGWIFTTYPIEWIDLNLGVYELPVVSFYWLTLSLVIGSASALLAITLYGVRGYSDRVVWVVGAPLLWLAAEVLGAFFFSLFTYGPGGTINAAFSFGMVGYPLAEHQVLLQFAQFGGAYLLSVIVVSVAWLGYNYRQYLLSGYRPAWLVCFFVLGISTQSLSLPIQTDPLPGSVAIIDTKFGGSEFFAAADQDVIKATALQEALEAAEALGVEYILLPEGAAIVAEAVPTPEAFARFRARYPHIQALVIESERVPLSADTVALRGRIYDTKMRVAFSVDKQQLVSQGEFMPTVYAQVFKVLGLESVVATISQKLDYRPGPFESQAALPAHIPSVLFCFAEAGPLSVRQLVAERPVPFVVQPISHAWFHAPESLWRQYDAMRKIHAVWNDVSIILVGNMATGAWYTPTGEKVIPEVVARGEWWTLRLIP